MGELVEKYEFHEKTNAHVWIVSGEKGAVHIWGVLKDGDEFGDPHDRLYGGIEAHYRSPPAYMADRPPSHDHCWALDAPCWHDGSSLQFQENFVDELGIKDIERGNHAPFFSLARTRYRQWMENDQ